MSYKQLLKYLRKVKRWEKRLQDMDDPNKGWLPEPENDERPTEAQTSEEFNEDEWLDIVEKDEKAIKSLEENTFVNFGVLWAIIDFVFE